MTRALPAAMAIFLALPGGAQPADCPAGTALSERPEARLLAAQRAIDLLAASHPRAPLLAGIPPVRLRNVVDEEVFGALAAAGVDPAPPSSDAEFLRRVTLDLTGRIPDIGATTAFLSDASPDRRARKIDELIASDAFADRWASFLSELYRVTAYSTTSFMGFRSRNAWHAYFRDALRKGTAYDEIARTVLTAAGSSGEVGPASFVVREIAANGPPQDTWDNLAAATGRALLGTNLSCLSCHDGAGHTDQLNVWLSGKTRADFWGMAAFFANTYVRAEYVEAEKEYRWDVFDVPFLQYRLDTTDGNKSPRRPGPDGSAVVFPREILSGQEPRPFEGRRQAIARLVTSHRQFARATVNYVFRELFNLGLVEPADGFDLARLDPASPPPAPWTVQPTHPALLERLAVAFERSGYDLTALVRLLVSSNAYQLSSSYPGDWRPAYVPLFARHIPRRLRAEELHDSISTATLLPLPLYVRGAPEPVPWASQLPDTLEPIGSDPSGVSYVVRDFLDAFGRGDRDLTPRRGDGSLLQALHLMNDPLVTFRVRSDVTGSLVFRLRAGVPFERRVDALYLATLSRFPTPEERLEGFRILLDPGRGEAQALEDLQHALLNQLEFVFCR